MMVLAPVRSDTLPENSTYRDDGCDVSPTCLKCPLPVCKYDDPEFLRRTSRNARDEAILAARHSEGRSVAALAVRFGVSTRTVHRVLQAERLGMRQLQVLPRLEPITEPGPASFRPPAPLPDIWPAAALYRDGAASPMSRISRIREEPVLAGAA
ncbi:MAG: hypothetical protein HY682_04510 [Chloroflexi bacterium]|nr:hypothetical protein [Chloroflexota bacterium]